MKIKHAAAITAATTAALCLTAIVAGPGAAAFPTQAPESKSLAQTSQEDTSFSLEDYIHPEAARLGTERGIKLKDGNGKMINVDCSTGGSIIKVESTDSNGDVCFQTTSTPAWLNMEITGSFGVMAGQKPLEVTSTADGIQEKMTVAANTPAAVGAADGESVVVQLKVN